MREGGCCCQGPTTSRDAICSDHKPNHGQLLSLAGWLLQEHHTRTTWCTQYPNLSDRSNRGLPTSHGANIQQTLCRLRYYTGREVKTMTVTGHCGRGTLHLHDSRERPAGATHHTWLQHLVLRSFQTVCRHDLMLTTVYCTHTCCPNSPYHFPMNCCWSKQPQDTPGCL
jgi:hypothetical protein